MRELFIYYRIDLAYAISARAAVQQFQHRLCERHPELTARLMCRPDDSSEMQTWMETYSFNDAAGISAALEAEIAAEAAALAPFIAGTRHTEVFIPCAW
jgi:hypothetical protein